MALDTHDVCAAAALAASLVGACEWVKIGLELFTAGGPEIVARCRQLGFSVFLDLKLLDIPNTVSGAVRAATRLGVSMLTVHASGGRRMLEAAAHAARDMDCGLRLLAVTVPTSLETSDLDEVGVAFSVSEQVLRLSKLAASVGLDGVVCSPMECAMLRQALPNVLLVVPGIRTSSDPSDDQKRTATAQEAIRAGADYLVIGRPITTALNPRAQLETLARQLSTSWAVDADLQSP